MWILMCMALLAPFSETPGLVANGGFEELTGEMPSGWAVYVAPTGPGATPASARLSGDARAGTYCALLETPEAYAEEPFNNWSQPVAGKHAGEALALSAWVKTEEAGGAAVWVQCWQREPLQVLEVINTGVAAPMAGTNDWQEVRAEFSPPAGTDFLMVRCVLKGAGKAWFDEVRLNKPEEEKAEEEGETAEASPTPEAPSAETAAPTPAPQAMPEPETETPMPTPDNAAASPPLPNEAQAPEAALDTSAIEAEIQRLRDTNALLTEALRAMRTDNSSLLESIGALQEQIDALERVLNPPPPDPNAPPPLVPQDFEEGAGR